MVNTELSQDWRQPFRERVEANLAIVNDLAAVGQDGEPGLLLAAAQQKMRPGQRSATLTPMEVCDTLVPHAADNLPVKPRWELAEYADIAVSQFARRRWKAVMVAAEALRMQLTGGSEDLTGVDAETAVFVAEGGENKSSIVSRANAEVCMQVYTGDPQEQTLYQFGGDRVIPPLCSLGAMNPEHIIMRSRAGEFLPKEEFTEFDASLAMAWADGYKDVGRETGRARAPLSLVTPSTAAMQRTVRLEHADAGRARLTLMQPEGKGLYGSLDALHSHLRRTGGLQHKKLVISTNGQYRPLAELTAMGWALKNNVAMPTPVAIGDEPGDVFAYKGDVESIRVFDRKYIVYLNELAILGRASLQLQQDLGLQSADNLH